MPGPWRLSDDEQFPGVTQRVRNILKRYGFRDLMEAARLSDVELRQRRQIGSATLAEIRKAERWCREDVLASDWPVF